MSAGQWILLSLVGIIALICFLATAFYGENAERNKEILNTIIGLGIFGFVIWIIVETLT